MLGKLAQEALFFSHHKAHAPSQCHEKTHVLALIQHMETAMTSHHHKTYHANANKSVVRPGSSEIEDNQEDAIATGG